MKEKFNVTGMTCSACSAHVERAVKALDGASEVQVNLLQNTMSVSYDEDILTPSMISAAVADAGYKAYAANDKSSPRGDLGRENTSFLENEARSMKNRLIWSIALLIPLMYIAMGSMVGLPIPGFLVGHENAITFAMAQLILTLGIMYLNRAYFEKGIKSLINRAPTMDALIAIGSSAAVIYGIYAIIRIGNGLAVQDFSVVEQYHMDLYFESAGTILTLITVGKYLESRSKGKTSDAISKLMDLAPKTAVVEREGKEIEIPIADVAVGDLVIVKAGSAIPVDGVILEGLAAVDESAITGESIPVEKAKGASVTGATVNKSGYLKVWASRVGEDTTLAQIIRLVEEAGASKAPIARLADKVSAVFVPAVILIAALATVIWLISGAQPSFALGIGISVLVISCPCALGLATPTAIMVGTGKGAEHGILYKNAESIETAHSIETVILDKTGTVTQGRPEVVGLFTSDGVTEKELLSLAASLERLSEHPLAEAIVEKSVEMGAELIPASDFVQTPGQGIEAELEGKKILAGNEKMMNERGVDVSELKPIAEKLSQKGETPLYFARDGKTLGLISVADRIKPDSLWAVDEFHKMGIEVILLTGDNEQTAKAIANELGIEKVIAGVLPQGKEAEVRKIQESGRKVAMIGDGINDAPALVRADVGIAIGAGTDVAIESADIVLMKSGLSDAVTAIKLSKATIRNIKQNLFWAFFYNILGIPLAAGVLFPGFGLKLNPMFASGAMSLSSLFVVTNALRLRFFKSDMPERAIEPVNTNTDEIKNEGENTMKLIMKIDGMSCNHCKMSAEKALNAIDGVSAVVNLEERQAEISLSRDVSKDILSDAITGAGFTVVSIS